MRFGDKLRACREKKGLTQAELGKLINVSDATINRYERNLREPDYETLKLFAKIFNCSTDYLLGLTDNPNPPNHEHKPDTDITDAQIAANMEGRYGEKPSPELVAFIKRVINEELEKRKN